MSELLPMGSRLYKEIPMTMPIILVIKSLNKIKIKVGIMVLTVLVENR